MTMFTYSAWVTRVIDGDTFEANVDLGFRIQINETFRVYDYGRPIIITLDDFANPEPGGIVTITTKHTVVGV